jgi:beta-galactosidase
LDRKGTLHPSAANEINFAVKGPGEIIGVGNGDQCSVESFQVRHRKAFNGRCQVVIKSTNRSGKIALTAESKGLRTAKAVITAR